MLFEARTIADINNVKQYEFVVLYRWLVTSVFLVIKISQSVNEYFSCD